MDTREQARAYIGLGSNLGDRAGNLLLAVRGMMNSGLRVERLSAIYETEPVGLASQPLFLNMAAELNGELPPPAALLARLLRVEYLLGRRREETGGPRTIDLDLLLYGNVVHENEFVTVPHPRLHSRRFVLSPLAEIAADETHPVLERTIGELLRNCDDPAGVEIWRP